MDVFEFAMKMEEDGKNFYQEIAEKTKNKGVKSILTMLPRPERWLEDAEWTHLEEY